MALVASTFALEIRDGFDLAVIAHHELVGAVARHAVLDFIADHAQVIQTRILDGKTERRKGQRSNIEFARGKRGDYRRGAFKARRLGDIGLAEMLQQLLFLQHQGRGRSRHDHPTDANL